MIEYWKDICYLFLALGTFLVGNKSKKITDKGGEIENLSKYQLMYDKFVSQYEKQFEHLEGVVQSLTDEVRNLELRNAIIIEKSESWKNRFNELQKLYDDLKHEFEQYKLKHKR